VPQQAVRLGLSRVSLPGRMQIMPGLPCVVLDVAHNPHAAAALSQGLDSMQYFPKTHAVLGMYSDKDVEGVVRRMAGRVHHWHCASLPGPRGMTGEKLAEIVRKVSAELNTGKSESVEAAAVSSVHASGSRPGVRPMVRP